MQWIKAIGRGILALIIVITVSLPSFARSMPMQTSQVQMSMGGLVNCHGQPCGDHQSKSPTPNKAGSCVTAFCTAPPVIAPNSIAAFSVMSYPLTHPIIAAAFPPGMSQSPDPYPPRQLTLI